MSKKQTEAERLADQLRDMCSNFRAPSHERGVLNDAIQRLDRLSAANAELLEALHKIAQSRASGEVQCIALAAIAKHQPPKEGTPS